jgi:hypothetical protein
MTEPVNSLKSVAQAYLTARKEAEAEPRRKRTAQVLRAFIDSEEGMAALRLLDAADTWIELAKLTQEHREYVLFLDARGMSIKEQVQGEHLRNKAPEQIPATMDYEASPEQAAHLIVAVGAAEIEGVLLEAREKLSQIAEKAL